jgi:N-dimethylarginine dimethylaminohydrolase
MTLQSMPTRPQRRVRVARPRRFLMCRPAHFDVVYSINPWMEPEKPTDRDLALIQWERLVNLFRGLGHQVELIDPIPGLPDMVFAANGATVVNGKVLSARFRYPQRADEGEIYADWFRARGYQVHRAEYINEGEGDYLFAGSRILGGTGFRTAPHSHAEAERLFGLPVQSLTLVDPRFYHLDTALSVLDADSELIMYYPKAFSEHSQQILRALYPDAILADDDDAEAFGLNAVSDGLHVLVAEQARHLIDELWAHGFVPIGVDLSELLKSGGSAKCCTLELREGSR